MSETSTCSCCGEERSATALARLQCHDDIAVCAGCIRWLSGQVQAHSTPILPLRDMAEALAFWQAAGCEVSSYDDTYAFVARDDAELVHLALEPVDPATNHAACYLFERDTERWHAEWAAAGLPVGPVETMPWGMVEFVVTDPSGNDVRVGRSAAPS